MSTEWKKLTLLAALDLIIALDRKEEERAQAKFQTAEIKWTRPELIHPILRRFPAPLRELMIAEFVEACSRISNPRAAAHISVDNLQCDCTFAWSYLLPCKHVFIADLRHGILTEQLWAQYLAQFEENGTAVYLQRMKVPMPLREQTEGELNAADADRVNHFTALLETIRNMFFKFVSHPSDRDREQATSVVERLRSMLHSRLHLYGRRVGIEGERLIPDPSIFDEDMNEFQREEFANDAAGLRLAHKDRSLSQSTLRK